ncbi:chromate transporter family protein [Sphaerosporella brunnea]|uniref:Chromate transporter family protein n=1 Tax=Sphaerosporella brunnea TaxID=1250544 RepID=A0A5J5ECY6_9PEZI|nr:chromate transporter family protein [Sphaerosporella brunnea]
MALNSIVSAGRQGASNNKLVSRFLDVISRTWDLGFTSFGGPPVHFQILHSRFVDGKGKTPWIDEQTYQELFAVCQALPGPASTKMVFSIAMIHAGILPATLVFLIWSLPGALGMFGLAMGVQRISEVLPSPVYALLSGLNSATVGIIALAAMQLARKAITDKLTRILVMFGGCGGLLYNALWYLPVLMVVGGLSTLVWDCWGQTQAQALRQRLKRRKSEPSQLEENISVPVDVAQDASESAAQRRVKSTATSHAGSGKEERNIIPPAPVETHQGYATKWGIVVIIVFFAFFITLMTVRGVLKHVPLPLAVFNNMFLAGTIIFGGGPVVIPLLREYVVVPGWVSPRDFLLGLALIQAFPGPNFNFAVYLGGLALDRTSTALGSVLGFLGIFIPGMVLQVGFQTLWRALRKRREVVSMLRGVHAAAVGLVFTAVYRLWEIGYLTPTESSGASLGKEPWWLAVSAATFTLVEWYAVPPAVAIILGGVAGLGWWGAIKPW